MNALLNLSNKMAELNLKNKVEILLTTPSQTTEFLKILY